MATLLQKAIDLAVKAHRTAEDPPGEPYIVHPMRVMLSVSQTDDAHQNELLRCVAILHDTVERGGITKKALRRAKMPPDVVRAVMLLTHDDRISYADYIITLKPDRLARAVKLADLMDNADLRHVTFRPAKRKDRSRLARYAASYKFLTDQLTQTEFRRVMASLEQ